MVNSRKQYIDRFSKAAVDSTKGTNLFPSVVMAQAILESSDSKGNAGNSQLAKFYNNHFGIKADIGWKGKKVMMPTREVIGGKSKMVNAWFRHYDNPEQSFNDRAQFLSKNPRYITAGVFIAKTPEAQAEALQRAGYATDPDYAKLLIGIINSNKLKSLDTVKNESPE